VLEQESLRVPAPLNQLPWDLAKDIAGGKKIHEQIDEAIRMYDRLLLILSEDSMNSEWVKTEIAKAR
jgi:hypothetical protein